MPDATIKEIELFVLNNRLPLGAHFSDPYNLFESPDLFSCIVSVITDGQTLDAGRTFIVKFHPGMQGTNWLHAKRSRNLDPSISIPIFQGTRFYDWLKTELPNWQLP